MHLAPFVFVSPLGACVFSFSYVPYYICSAQFCKESIAGNLGPYTASPHDSHAKTSTWFSRKSPMENCYLSGRFCKTVYFGYQMPEHKLFGHFFCPLFLWTHSCATLYAAAAYTKHTKTQYHLLLSEIPFVLWSLRFPSAKAKSKYILLRNILRWRYRKYGKQTDM